MYELGATCMARRDENGELVALGRLDMLPSVQPEPLTSELIPIEDREIAYGLLFKCSNCGTEFIINDALEHNYCSECGRKFVR